MSFMQGIDREISLLEFDKIRQKLTRYTYSPWGKESATTCLPSADFSRVEQMQEETSEACLLINEKGSPLSAVKEIRPVLLRAEKGGLLQAGELRDIGDFLQALDKVKAFFKDEKISQKICRLKEIASRIDLQTQLLRTIGHCIDQDGQILDRASSKLSALRRKKLYLQERIHARMQRFLKDASLQNILQDTLITIRNNRFVLPVKQGHRQSLPGVVHDYSASGATVFVEPLQIVEMHNDLHGVEREEEKEVERILREISSAVAEKVYSIKDSTELYGCLDYIFSRGYFSFEVKGLKPVLNRRGYLNIVQGRHPLLAAGVVPIDFYIGDQFRTLVITGPNTGGKTVTLKTVGLFALMVQSGLHIPAAQGTEFPVFKGVYADIGDEQSIEQSLSTFSGHLKNIIHILENADEHSLVLLDELGAGTDPSEGAALAMALLGELYRKQVVAIATTHFSALKVFTYRHKGMENASVEFDAKTFSPTYRVFIGIPGSSNAFAIAARLGLGESIIERAKAFLTQEELSMKDLMVSLAEKERSLHNDNLAAGGLRRELESLKEDLATEKSRLRERRARIIEKAYEEAGSIVRRAKKTTGTLVKELHKLCANGEKGSLKRAGELKEGLHLFQKELVAGASEALVKKNSLLKEDDLRAGLSVYIKSLKKKGEIITLTSKSEIQVQLGTMRITTTLDDLERTSPDVDGKHNEEKNRAIVLHFKKEAVEASVDLRGLNVDEAIEQVDKYFDKAYLGGLGSVTVIHGKGTGKLREGLHQYLKNHYLVENFRIGEREEGGEGATVVSLA